mmetsp:Transcript_27989/g.59702  ORF Transcript_27989/g.59702 Transcript_27989/m.59702 type:complete len:492 (+) Transcript_27989:286-1761(+)|eukprot:CAMPEP_0172304568 /NCGR_PEP_ID=MMETSP1058-20130122/5965_1 /TAXON_ID=83371 /ORGANISM="Detonula confervacea, Strain CCMP 353" /LENGTH=491 /DNA_ID=CAMNT_0013015855 /DNA_START=25 /DNA_END=1500 /DNA_ORIENTATION=+
MATPFHLTEQDLHSSSHDDDDFDAQSEAAAMMNKIPILKRRAAAAAATSNTTNMNTTATTPTTAPNSDPICVIVVGMAGSGKTTLMAQLQRSLNLKARAKNNGHVDDGGDEPLEDGNAKDDKNDSKKVPTTTPTAQRAGYAINLDPAAKYIPFTSSIDIRDTVDYVEVMRQHKLGPNGAILTCLNLFATKFDQVMDILERRAFGSSVLSSASTGEVGEVVSNAAGVNDNNHHHEKKEKGKETKTNSNHSEEPKAVAESHQKEKDTTSTSDSPITTTLDPLDYILIDTPGQIEAFTWSASGTIVTSALATAFPTVLAFVIDTPRCAASVHTFMSNMLYACSMLYRAKLPMVVVLNKTDVVGCEFIKEWMDDYESFQEALDDASNNSTSQGEAGYSDEMAGGTAGGSGYYASLTRSLSLVLDEFYNHLHKVGVSAATGDGVDEFWEVVQKAAEEYEDGYLVDLKHRMEEQQAKERAKKRVGARRLARDLEEEE